MWFGKYKDEKDKEKQNSEGVEQESRLDYLLRELKEDSVL